MHQVETNFEKFITDASQATLHKYCMEYCKTLRQRGWSLADIKFVYGPVGFRTPAGIRGMLNRLQTELPTTRT